MEKTAVSTDKKNSGGCDLLACCDIQTGYEKPDVLAE